MTQPLPECGREQSGRDALEILGGCESDRSESEYAIWAKSQNFTAQYVDLVDSLCAR